MTALRNLVRNRTVAVCTANNANIYAAYRTRGGWEGWLQVELARDLANNLPGTATLIRENAAYYVGGQRADITIDLGVGLPKLVVELKCESMWQQALGGGNRLSARYTADVAKTANLIGAPPGGLSLLALGVTVSSVCDQFDMLFNGAMAGVFNTRNVAHQVIGSGFAIAVYAN